MIARLVIPSIAGYLLLNYGFNLGIINPLMNYQAPSEAAKFIKENKIVTKNIYLYNENKKAKSRSFNFYLNINTKYIDQTYLKSQNFLEPTLIYTDSSGYSELLKYYKNIKILKTFDHIRVSKLQLAFFKKETRNSMIEKKYLLKLS